MCIMDDPLNIKINIPLLIISLNGVTCLTFLFVITVERAFSTCFDTAPLLGVFSHSFSLWDFIQSGTLIKLV